MCSTIGNTHSNGREYDIKTFLHLKHEDEQPFSKSTQNMSKRLFAGSIIYLIGSLVAGFGGYLYQLFMGRMLSLDDFGALSSLANFFSIIAIPSAALTLLVTQTVATLRAQERLGAVRFFLRSMTFRALAGGVAVFVVSVVFIYPVSHFLKIASPVPVFIFSASILFSLLLAVRRGALLGFQDFYAVSWSSIIESGSKILTALLLVYFGFALSGAAGAIFIGVILAYIFSFFQIRILRSSIVEQIHIRDHVFHIGPVVLWNIAMTLFASADIILVRKFFSPDETGLYAGISLLAKMVFFCAGAVASVLFPMVAELYAQGNHAAHRALLWRALMVVVGICSLGVIAYVVAPDGIVNMLFGSRYIPFLKYLVPLTIAFGFLAIVQLVSNYLLSTRQRWFMVPLLCAPVVEIVAIVMLHHTIGQVIWSMALTFGVLAMVLLIGIMWRARPRAEVNI